MDLIDRDTQLKLHGEAAITGVPPADEAFCEHATCPACRSKGLDYSERYHRSSGNYEPIATCRSCGDAFLVRELVDGGRRRS